MSAVYSDTIRRWAADGRRAGVLVDADGIGEVGLGEGEAGRRLAVRFALRVSGELAESVRFQVFGCGFTIAACAAAAELAEGRRLGEIERLTAAAIDAALAGLPRERSYCAELAAAALHAALRSARGDRQPVRAGIQSAPPDPGPRITAAHPVYRLLVDRPAPPAVSPEDRHLFACLLAVAAGEAPAPAAALGLSAPELADLLQLCFPGVTTAHLRPLCATATVPLPPVDPDLLQLLFSFLPQDGDGRTPASSLWLARAIAARSARPGHLWLAMGLFARAELTAAVRRHLPALALANERGMRWKRFLFKELCARSGSSLCKTPDCGACSDSAECFAPE